MVGRIWSCAGPSRDAGQYAAPVAGQSMRRTNPQMWHWASPVWALGSSMLGQPLVPQNKRELATEEVRRRMRRIAEARPVKDAVAERVIIVRFPGVFLARSGIA